MVSSRVVTKWAIPDTVQDTGNVPLQRRMPWKTFYYHYSLPVCSSHLVIKGFKKLRRIFCVEIVIADELVSTRANDPATLKVNCNSAHYNQVCWKANYATVTEKVYISTFSTVDDVNEGWPIVGTEKECHDWDQGLPLFVWRDAVGADREIRFLFIR